MRIAGQIAVGMWFERELIRAVVDEERVEEERKKASRDARKRVDWFWIRVLGLACFAVKTRDVTVCCRAREKNFHRSPSLSATLSL